MLLLGNICTGKSYAVGCIADALIDRMISVLYVGMSDVVNCMQGNFSVDRDSLKEMKEQYGADFHISADGE